MIESGTSNYNLKIKILLVGLLCLTGASIFTAALGLNHFSFQQFIILAFAFGVSSVINQHQIRIPKTKASLTAAEATVLWGMIWLGAPGAVLLAASAGLARYKAEDAQPVRWLCETTVRVIAAFLAACTFYYLLNRFGNYPLSALGADFVSAEWFAAALGAALLVHALVTGALGALLRAFDGLYAAPTNWKTFLLAPAGGYLLGLPIALSIHAAFLQFDLAFGWLLAPLAIISHTAYRIHHKKLEQKTKEIVEASRIHLATVEALATAIDARDQMGVGHVRRTQVYAVGVGRIMELSDDEIQALNTGALLHDIGKLAVPDHILNKPGRLTPAELEKTKIHPVVGASIIGKVDFSYPVVPTVKYHHECWDGSGYPEGLEGTEIPLTARILAVVDCYDTLRAARPYRPAISREEARKYLFNQAGTQFDPKIVDIFLRNLHVLEAELDKEGLAYRDENLPAGEVIHQADNSPKSYVDQIKSANREVYALYELARVFSSSLNLQETLSLFAEKIGELVPFDTLVVYLFDENEDAARAVYAEGKNSETLLKRPVKPGHGATGYVLQNRQPVSNVNPGLDFSFCQLELVQDYSAMASLPLVAGSKMLGAVSLYSCALENYEDEHLRLLETISVIASDTISKSIHHAETETRALTDPMTGLPNARSLQVQFEKEVARAGRNDTTFQLLMLDLDGFKAVNDTFGHKTGDKLLKEVSLVMRMQLRDYDFLARYAGDEFVAIIPETDNVSVEDLCQRLEKAVRDFVLPVGDNQFARVGVSVGAAGYPNGGDSLDQLLIAADKAMYRVKAARKKRLVKELKKLHENAPAETELLLKPLNPTPITIRPTAAASYRNHASSAATAEENFVVELDESHIISSAVN